MLFTGAADRIVHPVIRYSSNKRGFRYITAFILLLAVSALPLVIGFVLAMVIGGVAVFVACAAIFGIIDFILTRILLQSAYKYIAVQRKKSSEEEYRILLALYDITMEFSRREREKEEHEKIKESTSN